VIKTMADLVRMAGKFYVIGELVLCDTRLDTWQQLRPESDLFVLLYEEPEKPIVTPIPNLFHNESHVARTAPELPKEVVVAADPVHGDNRLSPSTTIEEKPRRGKRRL
jgi:hypothetical protein